MRYGQRFWRIMMRKLGKAAAPHKTMEAAGEPERQRIGARIGIARPAENGTSDRSCIIEPLGNHIAEK